MAAVDKVLGSFIGNLVPSFDALDQSVQQIAMKIATNKLLSGTTRDLIADATQFAAKQAPTSGIHPGMNKNIKSASEILSRTNSNNFDDNIKLFGDTLKKNKGADVQGIDEYMAQMTAQMNASRKTADSTFTGKSAHDLFAQNIDVNGDESYSIMGTLNYLSQYPRAYFKGADAEASAFVGMNRKMGLIGGTGASMIGSRYAKGGSLTEDQYGDRNIAGVPFI